MNTINAALFGTWWYTDIASTPNERPTLRIETPTKPSRRAANSKAASTVNGGSVGK